MANSLASTSIAPPSLHRRRHHPIFRLNFRPKVRDFQFCAKNPANNSSESEPENALLKIAWYGSEFLGIAASFLRSPSKTADSGADLELSVDGFGKIDRATVVESIKEDFHRSYFVTAYGEKLVPCYFIFGDSLVDNGNNNNRNTVAKANYPPYGVDFPGGPTGRFSNGRNAADFIAEALGFPDHIPSFASASGDAILNGVNYASGGAGILPRTGKQLGDVISLDEQLQNHQVTIKNTVSILGSAEAANEHLRQCIYTVGMGSNDYAAYATAIPPQTPDQYAQRLVDQYSTQLKNLYTLGARKVAVFGLGTIGCVPAALRGAMYGPLCETETKATCGVFDDKLKSLVDVLNKDLVGSNFTFINVFGITVSDPAAMAFQVSNLPCCITTLAGSCIPLGPTCMNRAGYFFFDGFHPTEASALIVAKRAFKALSPSDAYPFDIQHLAQAK